MSLKVWIKLMFSVTVIALIYIHMQMKIFDLAYQGKDKEKLVHDLRDRNGVLTHQILTLKSANHLGNQLLDKDSTMQFMSFDHVLTLNGPATINRKLDTRSAKAKNENSWNILSYFTPQEAKAWDKE